MSKVRIVSAPVSGKRKVRITDMPMIGIGTQGPAATPDAIMMALGGTNYVPGGDGKYASQQPGHGYSLNRYGWNTPAGPLGTTSKVQPFARVGKVLPEAPPGQGDINAEKNERILGDFDQDGNMELMNVGGPSHAAGGKNVDVPSHSFVFSDTKDLKIKDPAVLAQFGITSMKRGGYTPASIAAKYDLNKYKAITSNPDADDYATKTAQLMSDNYLAKLSKLAQVQEQMKGQMGMEHHDPDFGQQPAMQLGGSGPVAKPPYGSDYAPWDPRIGQAQEYPSDLPQTTADYQRFANARGAGLKVDDKLGYRTLGWENPDSSIPSLEPAPLSPNGIWGSDNMTDSSPVVQTPTYAGSTPQPLENKTNVPNRSRHNWNVGIDPNFYGNLQNVLQMANLRKFRPYEPVPQAVIPDTVFLDPTRAIAAQQEEARSGSEMDQMSANPQASRAMGLARQGVTGAQAANTISQYHNQNIGIANAANQNAAQITNSLMEKQANRLSELNKANFLSDRDYQKQMSTLQKEYALRLQQQHNADVNRQRYNKWNPYFTMDRSGYYQLKPDVTDVKLQEIYRGQDQSAKSDVYQAFADDLKKIKAAGITDPAEVAMAVKHLESTRQKATYNASGALKSFTESGYEQDGERPSYQRKYGGPLMKMGGKTTNLYDNTKLRKFLK